MVMQSFFFAIFTAKTAQDHFVFVFATVAKDITNLSPHGKYLHIWRRGERPAPTLPLFFKPPALLPQNLTIFFYGNGLAI